MNLFVQKYWRELAPRPKCWSGCQGFIEPDLSTLLNKITTVLEVIELQMYHDLDKKSINLW